MDIPHVKNLITINASVPVGAATVKFLGTNNCN